MWECGSYSLSFDTAAVWNMKRSMNDGDGDFGAKRRSTGGMSNEMRILLPSQVLAHLGYCSSRELLTVLRIKK